MARRGTAPEPPGRAHRVIVILLLLVPITAACDEGGSERRNGLFTYDEGAPLTIRTKDAWQSGYLRVTSLTYASPMGGRVPALVLAPRGKSPFAGLIVQHGLPGDKIAMLQVAEDMARLGAVVVAIDAPWAGPNASSRSPSATAPIRSS